MKKKLSKKSQSGASLVEYCLLICLIALGTLTALKNFGVELDKMMVSSNNQLGGGTERGIPSGWGGNPATGGPKGDN